MMFVPSSLTVTRFRFTHPVLRVINGTVLDLPSPVNFSMWWNFGSLLGLVLMIQLLTGLFLAMHYTSDVDLAFASVSHIFRDVNGGWMLRSLHANGASFFFICLYCHVGRGIYYGSYMYKGVWLSGMALMLMVMAAAFLGYVLPWGQMSFWGATVITNLFSAFPYFGSTLVSWLWGGFSVGNPTLTRFFTFHFLVPFAVAAGAGLHIFLLHESGSNNPLGVNSDADKIPFHWYYSIKDIVGFVVMASALLGLVLMAPNYLGEPDNFLPANPLVTPPHIVPEWYFLFAYAILRSITNKLGGVLGLFASILILAVLPGLHKNQMKGMSFYPFSKLFYWLFIIAFLMLTVGGAWPVEQPFIITTQIFSAIYFSFFCAASGLRQGWDTVLD